MESTTNPSLATLFGLLFVLAGPIKAMPVFRALSAGMERRARSTLALKAAAFGALGIALAAGMAEAMLAKYGVAGPGIAAAAGLLLVLVGVLPILGKDAQPEIPSPPDALSLAFPVLLPPHAFGLILLFCFYLPEKILTFILLGSALMSMNAVAMMFADAVLKRTGMVPLRLLGAIFGILQVALGMQMLLWSLTTALSSAG
jgi:multiple antibiotic resistance protein